MVVGCFGWCNCRVSIWVFVSSGWSSGFRDHSYLSLQVQDWVYFEDFIG